LSLYKGQINFVLDEESSLILLTPDGVRDTLVHAELPPDLRLVSLRYLSSAGDLLQLMNSRKKRTAAVLTTSILRVIYNNLAYSVTGA
jgi:hypothetical protein